jgi:hypothetical protein
LFSRVCPESQPHHSKFIVSQPVPHLTVNGTVQHMHVYALLSLTRTNRVILTTASFLQTIVYIYYRIIFTTALGVGGLTLVSPHNNLMTDSSLVTM